jgi:hypothetical protein
MTQHKTLLLSAMIALLMGSCGIQANAATAQESASSLPVQLITA